MEHKVRHVFNYKFSSMQFPELYQWSWEIFRSFWVCTLLTTALLSCLFLWLISLVDFSILPHSWSPCASHFLLPLLVIVQREDEGKWPMTVETGVVIYEMKYENVRLPVPWLKYCYTHLFLYHVCCAWKLKTSQRHHVSLSHKYHTTNIWYIHNSHTHTLHTTRTVKICVYVTVQIVKNEIEMSTVEKKKAKLRPVSVIFLVMMHTRVVWTQLK